MAFTPQAKKELAKLGSVDQKRVSKFLGASIEGAANPRRSGKSLSGASSEFWRYRVGNIRILCRLEDETATVLVVTVGHRREVYR